MTDKETPAQWLAVFSAIREDAKRIIQKVDDAVAAENEQATIEALKEAAANFPAVIDRLKAVPDPAEKDLKEIKKKFQAAYKVFFDGLNYGLDYFNVTSPWNRSVWWSTAEVATTKLGEANTAYIRASKRLKASKDQG
ncbi:hypothetical protein ABFB09_03200 [Dehalogenimonas sp. THU2]|uniref:hypothetical protein n=1 Tax=Dehalogenimonas sp. THU2 TaxID=3151121 RepID=UPI0032189314